MRGNFPMEVFGLGKIISRISYKVVDILDNKVCPVKGTGEDKKLRCKHKEIIWKFGTKLRKGKGMEMLSIYFVKILHTCAQTSLDFGK